MNDPFIHDQARRFARRLQRVASNDGKRIDLAHRLLFGRPATPSEMDAGEKYLREMTALINDASQLQQFPPRRWEMLAPTAHEGPVLWKYTFDKPDGAWFKSAFDDSSWQDGAAAFGPKRVVRQPTHAVYTVWKTDDIWMRRPFVFSDRPIAPPQLRVYHLGDTKVYLNGVLAAEPAGGRNGYEYVSIREEAVDAMRPGENILAVHCSKNQTGRFIDVGLVEQAELDALIDGAWASYLRVLLSSNEFIYVD